MQEFVSSLGPVCAIIGAQWGDEGKGKVTDILAQHFDVIARACGGANAGHTIVIDGQKHVFHLLPSGCLHDGKPVVLGAGMVLHLPTLLAEIETLKQHGIALLDRLHISPEAHIVFDFHKEIDAALEAMRSAEKGQGIGTTKRGIGPAYMDKAARCGVRMERLADDLSAELRARAANLRTAYGVEIDIKKELEQLAAARSLLAGRVVDTIGLLHSAAETGRSILIEGAQATLLDIDHGTYPYVTSSSTTAAGALQGLGLAPRMLSSCIGVAKAYCTRVGSGPFLTEMEPGQAERVRTRGGEFGSTTGRPRRCGWMHIPDLQFSSRINGITHWNITKLDVLDDEEEVLVGTGTMGDAEAAYTTLSGWKRSTVGLTEYEELPAEARRFLELIEAQTGVPASLIGTGQGRGEMIIRG